MQIELISMKNTKNNYFNKRIFQIKFQKRKKLMQNASHNFMQQNRCEKLNGSKIIIKFIHHNFATSRLKSEKKRILCACNNTFSLILTSNVCAVQNRPYVVISLSMMHFVFRCFSFVLFNINNCPAGGLACVFTGPKFTFYLF